MTEGQAIWYRQTCIGGYDFKQDVPGVFVRRTARRCIVELRLKDGTAKRVAVLPANVRPRDPAAVWR